MSAISIEEALILLIEKRSELFSQQDRQDSVKEAVNWSDDRKQLGNQIYDWLKARQNLYHSA